MKNIVFTFSILLSLLSACAPVQTIQPDTANINTKVPDITGTPSLVVSTPTITATPYELVIRMSPTLDAWDKRIELPVDKKHWVTIGVPEEDINAVDYFKKIAINSKGIGWVKTSSGLMKVSGKNLKSIPLLQLFGIEPPDPSISITGTNNRTRKYNLPIATSLYGTEIKNLVVDKDDRLWISFDGPISDVIMIGNDTIGWTPFLMDGPVNNISVDRLGTVWLTYLSGEGTYRLVRYLGGTFVNSIAVPATPQIKNIFSMVFDADNQIWLDTDVGIFRLSNGEWEEIPAAGDEDNANHCYGESMSTKHELSTGSNREIWGIRGVCLIAWQGSGWKIIHAIPNDPSDLVSIVFDKEGRVWTGNGYLDDGINYIFTSKNLYQLNDIAVAPDNSIWYASAHFLSIFDNKGE
jgi:ligand-binding sensor domain-containing protein